MYGSGLDMKLVKQVSGAARRTVEDWIKAYRAYGVGGLKPGWKGGNSRKLAVQEREELVTRLQHMTVGQALSQEEGGHSSPFWTVEAVERVVEKWYGVRYRSRESYRLLLVEAGFSFQQPEGIYRARPSEAVIADFEADAEKSDRLQAKSPGRTDYHDGRNEFIPASDHHSRLVSRRSATHRRRESTARLSALVRRVVPQ